MTIVAQPSTYSARHDAAIRVHVPYTEPEPILAYRRRLLTARDLAAAALSNSHRHTEEALWLARITNTVAASFCYRSAPADKLKDAADLCARLLQCAAALKSLGESVE